MPGSTEIMQLQARLARLAEEYAGLRAIVENMALRIDSLEEAIQLRADATKAQEPTPDTATRRGGSQTRLPPTYRTNIPKPPPIPKHKP